MKRVFWIFLFLLACVFGWWDALLRTDLLWFWQLEPALPLAVLFLAFRKRSWAFLLAGVAALFLDAFAIGTFSLAFLRWLALLFLIDVLFQHFFTNRSLPALVLLMALGRGFDFFSIWMVNRLTVFLGWQSYLFFFDRIDLIVFGWDFCLVLVGFLLWMSFAPRWRADRV